MVTKKRQAPILTYENVMFASVFSLLFMLANYIMIDNGDGHAMIDSQNPFMILTFIAIWIYLHKNSYIHISNIRLLFLSLWCVYLSVIFYSMLIQDHFVWVEAIIFILITIILLYRIPERMITILIIAAWISLPSLLLADITLNESGATLVLIFTVGFLIIPKTNRAMIYYMLPTFLLLNIITMSRTAIGVYLLIAVIQLAWINFYNTPIKQKKHFAIIAGGGILLILVGFAQPLYQFFIGGRTQSKWHTVECFDIRTL